MESCCIIHCILSFIYLFQRHNFSPHLCCHRIQSKPMLEETIHIISDAELIIYGLHSLEVCPAFSQVDVNVSLAVICCSGIRSSDSILIFHSYLCRCRFTQAPPVRAHKVGPSKWCDIQLHTPVAQERWSPPYCYRGLRFEHVSTPWC